jgi:hypothetical protein
MWHCLAALPTRSVNSTGLAGPLHCGFAATADRDLLLPRSDTVVLETERLQQLAGDREVFFAPVRLVQDVKILVR